MFLFIHAFHRGGRATLRTIMQNTKSLRASIFDFIIISYKKSLHPVQTLFRTPFCKESWPALTPIFSFTCLDGFKPGHREPTTLQRKTTIQVHYSWCETNLDIHSRASPFFDRCTNGFQPVATNDAYQPPGFCSKHQKRTTVVVDARRKQRGSTIFLIQAPAAFSQVT